MKINKEQINELIKLKNEGKTQLQLAKDFNVCLSTIQYHTDEKQRNKRINYSKNYYNNLDDNKKKLINKRRKEYYKNYTKNRYKNDLEYRKKVIKYQKEWKKKKNEKKNK